MRQYPDACNTVLVLKIQDIDARSWSSTPETAKGPVKEELIKTTHVEEPFESANDSQKVLPEIQQPLLNVFRILP